MSVRLKVPEFDAIGGIARTVAVERDKGVLEVTLIGDRESMVTVARRLLQGRVDGVLDGTPIRMSRYSLLNQGNPMRLHMTVAYEVRNPSDRLAPLDL